MLFLCKIGGPQGPKQRVIQNIVLNDTSGRAFHQRVMEGHTLVRTPMIASAMILQKSIEALFPLYCARPKCRARLAKIPPESVHSILKPEAFVSARPEDQ